jgi:NADH-quinone oxidoreductase subunit C
MDASPILDVLRQAVPGASLADIGGFDMPAIETDREHIAPVLDSLRDHPSLQFAFLSDLMGTDAWPTEPRFVIVYQLACLGEAFKSAGATNAAPARRLRVKVRAHGDDPRVPTATGIFPSANWPEREVFDLFGVSFDGHPDLRRILTPDDWTGYPLRKDYPVQIRKDTVSWSPIQLTAEEFAANVRATRERASKQAGRS